MSEKILIVDDDVDSLKLIGLMLQRQGYEVSAANAGNQALTKAVKEKPDLIILDVMMPDMNGYEVCRRLRANDETSAIPIIMFTAKTLIDDKVAGFEAGADDYLTKPTHPAELASRIKSILQRSGAKRRAGSDRGLTIGVVGVKGGVGVTTLALNLAASLQAMNQTPVVADFRPGHGTLGLSIGMGGTSGMGNLLTRPAADITVEMIQREMSTHQSGLRTLLSSHNPREALIKIYPDTAVAVINHLRTIGKPAVYDLGSGYSPLIAKVHPEMDRLLLVLDPTNAALSLARDLLREFGQSNRERISLVVINRSKIAQQPPWHEVEAALEQEIGAIISPAPDLAFQALQAATPIVTHQPNAIISSQINKLAQEVNAVN